MRSIIFGAGGQLGQEWINQLNSSSDPFFDHFYGYNSQEVDITNPAKVTNALDSENPDIVINCAAYTNVDEAEEKKDVAQKVNSVAVADLARQCAERQIKLVHYSTDYIFPGNEEDRARLPQGYPEDYSTNPINWYGATKLKGEEAIRQSGAEYLILRTSWLCGAFGSNFVTTMLKLVEQRKELDVVNDQWGSPSFAENMVQNTITLLSQDCTGVYHITSGGITTWYDFACEIFSRTSKEIQVNPVSSSAFETKAERPHFSKLSTEKLASVEGTNIVHWKSGLQNLLNKLNQ